MKLFMHYKNKPYKYIGEARHSETQEDLVIYETLYDNPSAKIWVRPKEMFFESIELNGELTPRFRQVPLQIDVTTFIGEPELEKIGAIMETVFGEYDPAIFYSKLANTNNFHLGLASVDDKVVGFKIGYARDNDEFYSWLGAVLPQFEGLGIAKALMETQHNWCREHGYKRVYTNTQNRFRNMLFLNLKMGFEIIGTTLNEKNELKIQMEKKL